MTCKPLDLRLIVSCKRLCYGAVVARSIDADAARPRTTSPYEFFLQVARSHVPKHRFSGEFPHWRDAALADVLATLGTLPPPVDPRPQLVAEWETATLIEQRWLIDLHEGLSATAYISRPRGLEPGTRRPGILCWHGHTSGGKDGVMGHESRPEVSGAIAETRTDYGRRMAEAGFVTLAVDWMGYGDLDDRTTPHHYDIANGRDWCNLYYLHATMLGMTPLGLNLCHGRALIDFARTLPFLDADRLGVMGLSGGGTMALWSALLDQRIRAIEVICYSELFKNFGFRDVNYCGSQITPGLFDLVDLPDLQGLLAPRPLLVDIGVHDEGFRVESALACYEKTRQVYAAADAPDRLWLDLFPGQHEWSGRRSVAFFSQYLDERA